jgi:hypothetical protein
MNVRGGRGVKKNSSADKITTTLQQQLYNYWGAKKERKEEEGQWPLVYLSICLTDLVLFLKFFIGLGHTRSLGERISLISKIDKEKPTRNSPRMKYLAFTT